jgi:hypothetical protein
MGCCHCTTQAQPRCALVLAPWSPTFTQSGPEGTPCAHAGVRDGLSSRYCTVGNVLNWTGQYQFLKRIQPRMRIVIPLTLLIVFLILYSVRGVPYSHYEPTPAGVQPGRRSSRRARSSLLVSCALILRAGRRAWIFSRISARVSHERSMRARS